MNKYTLVTFRLGAPDSIPDALQSLVSRLESEAAVLARGTYILRPDAQTELLEQTQTTLRQTIKYFAMVSFYTNFEDCAGSLPMMFRLPPEAKALLDKEDA